MTLQHKLYSREWCQEHYSCFRAPTVISKPVCTTCEVFSIYPQKGFQYLFEKICGPEIQRISLCVDHIFPYLSKPKLYLLCVSISGMLNSFLLCRNHQRWKIRDVCLDFWEASVLFPFGREMKRWRRIMLYCLLLCTIYTTSLMIVFFNRGMK